MCGIVAMKNKGLNSKEAKNVILSHYKNQQNRGNDSYGLVVGIKGNTEFARYRSKTLKPMENHQIWDKIEVDSIILFHHRLATSAPIHWKFQHPFISEDGKIALCHNGSITNYPSLYDKQKEKHTFESEYFTQKHTYAKNKEGKMEVIMNGTLYVSINDSEVLLHSYEDGGVEQLYQDAMGASTSAIADLKQKKLVLFAYTTPMTYKVCKKYFIASSEHFLNGTTKLKDRHKLEIGEDDVPVVSEVTLHYDWDKKGKYDESASSITSDAVMKQLQDDYAASYHGYGHAGRYKRDSLGRYGLEEY